MVRESAKTRGSNPSEETRCGINQSTSVKPLRWQLPRRISHNGAITKAGEATNVTTRRQTQISTSHGIISLVILLHCTKSSALIGVPGRSG